MNFTRHLLVLLLAITASQICSSQKIGIDRAEKSVFTYYSVPDERFSISADGSIAYSLRLGGALPINFYPRNSNRTSATKLRTFNLDIELSTDQDLFSSEDLTKLRPGLKLMFGRNVTIDQFDNLETRLPKKKKSLKTYGYSAFVSIGNIKYFDSTTKVINKKYPLEYGVEGYWNAIFRNSKTETKSRILFATTISLSRTWNEDDLLFYQDITKSIITPQVVAMEDFDGRFGILKQSLNNMRLSASLPMYFGHFNPIPFVALRAREQSTPAYYFGIFLNVLAKKDLLDAHLFKIPPTLGFGIDWKYHEKTLSKPALFVKGEIGFGK